MRRRAAGCAGEPLKLLLSTAAAAALESSCSLPTTAALDDPTTPGCSFRVFGGSIGGGVGFAGPPPGNMLHISQTLGQEYIVFDCSYNTGRLVFVDNMNQWCPSKRGLKLAASTWVKLA